jgi:REP element-mobilizing transposase RayT
LTYSVVDWLPIFVTEKTCRTITDSLTFCHRQKHLGINAYVIMPTHMHLIAFDRDFDNKRLEQTLSDFRKFTGRQLSDLCGTHFPACFAAVLRENAAEDRARRLWQPSRHPEAIQTERFWQQKVDYLHDNPCRKGLVRQPDHWRFSSAVFYVSDGRIACDVPITQAAW